MLVQDPKKLRKLAVLQGVSQRQIAMAVYGTTNHSYVARILNGKVKSVTPDAAVKWAKLFEADVTDLFLPQATKNPRRCNHGCAA